MCKAVSRGAGVIFRFFMLGAFARGVGLKVEAAHKTL